MEQPKTDPALLARLVEAARTYRPTPQEVFNQRVSYVYGQMMGRVSRERVRAILSGQ